LFFQGALRQDCRIASYPNYEAIAESTPITPAPRPKPSHLFIDLDLATFAGDGDTGHRLDLALKKTLKNIYSQLGGAVPTVLWSGGGYHIHLPIAIDNAFEDIPEFKRYKDPSIRFLRYAERQLTGGKADRNHCVSFRSCMARVPGSVNSKYTGGMANVIIVQRWNGVRARPTTQFMLTDFLIWLVQTEFDTRMRFQKQAQKFPMSSQIRETTGIEWIERLLQIPIPDWRKTAVALILAPYLLTIKHMSYEQAYHTIMQWAARCAQLSSLRPNDRGFIDRVHISLERAQSKQSRPLRWVTLVQKYSGLYEILTTY
jgi:hypothetical protein